MALLESGEMYLETIYVLSQKSSTVRSIDVSEHMGFSKPSVSRAIGILKKESLVETDEKGYLILTSKGEKLAKQIYERHTVLSKALLGLGVNEKTANEDACRIEHYLSDESFNAIKRHINCKK